MAIADRNVRDAVETIAHEFASMEGLVEDLQHRCSSLEDDNQELQEKVDMLEAKVKELEEALVEAHLTGESDGERTTAPEDEL